MARLREGLTLAQVRLLFLLLLLLLLLLLILPLLLLLLMPLLLFLLLQVNGMLDLGDIGGERVTTLGLDPDDTRLKPRLEDDFAVQVCSCLFFSYFFLLFVLQVLPLIEEVLYDKVLSLLHLLDPSTEQLTTKRAAQPYLLRYFYLLLLISILQARRQGS